MKFNRYSAAIAVAATIQTCAAQTYTDCNPTEATCDPDNGLATYRFSTDFTTGDSSFDGWNTTSGTVTSTDLGALFTISEQGDAPTIESEFYIFFGYVEVKMRAANGTGIVSTAILESDDLDEIDWEQVSTFNTEIQTNYFGKGNTTSYDRATTVTVDTPEDTFHTYGIEWTESATNWYVDGALVRTLNYADAVDGTNYPQTPMRIRIGIWAGGDPDNSEGTIEWAGGETDYTEGPFNMYVESVSIINYNPADTYTWTDQTGSYTSISAANGTSDGTTLSSSSASSSSTSSASSSSSSTAVIPSTSEGSSTSTTGESSSNAGATATYGGCASASASTSSSACASTSDVVYSSTAPVGSSNWSSVVGAFCLVSLATIVTAMMPL
ncbi:concanavalin A-like lectin/glucanase domain-containing protein [Aspergillus pseudodeflectus]|uniref:Crh-like protein n=1 Tax=Aspergillus pseudodeflectus TaxID=176178 RepID=A0ABR4K3X3_9EURO